MCLSPTSAACATRQIGLELVFDGLRSHEFAARGLEEFFLAVGDVEKSVGIEAGDIAGAKPAVVVETFRIRLRLLPVSGKDRGAANEKFAVLGKFEFDVGQRLARPRPCGGWRAS